jgi:hypothetical protein
MVILCISFSSSATCSPGAPRDSGDGGGSGGREGNFYLISVLFRLVLFSLLTNIYDDIVGFRRCDMDAMREIVSGSALSSIIKLPKSLQNRKVEIIVLPVVEAAETDKPLPKISGDKIRALKKNSSSVKLTGAIPHAAITIAEIREERLAEKYGSID